MKIGKYDVREVRTDQNGELWFLVQADNRDLAAWWMLFADDPDGYEESSNNLPEFTMEKYILIPARPRAIALRNEYEEHDKRVKEDDGYLG